MKHTLRDFLKLICAPGEAIHPQQQNLPGESLKRAGDYNILLWLHPVFLDAKASLAPTMVIGYRTLAPTDISSPSRILAPPIAVTAGINQTKEDSRSALVAKGGGPAELG